MGRVHSTLFTLVIGNKKKRKKKSHQVPLGLLPAAEECKDKDKRKSLLRKKQDLALHYKTENKVTISKKK